MLTLTATELAQHYRVTPGYVTLPDGTRVRMTEFQVSKARRYIRRAPKQASYRSDAGSDMATGDAR